MCESFSFAEEGGKKVCMYSVYSVNAGNSMRSYIAATVESRSSFSNPPPPTVVDLVLRVMLFLFFPQRGEGRRGPGARDRHALRALR